MKHCILLIAILMMFSDQANAAFIVRGKEQSAYREAAQEKRVAHQHLKNNLLKHFLLNKVYAFHRAPGFESRYQDNPTYGIISFVAGLIGLACVGLIAASVSPGIFAVVGGIAAILAIICGGMGLNRQMRGLAIAGMVLGIAEILAGIILVVFWVVVLAQFF